MTDGVANVGLGALDELGDSEEAEAAASEFYERVGRFARQKGVTIDIIGVEGEGCFAIGNLAAMVKASKVEEHDGHATDKEMIAMMVTAQKTVSQTLAGAGELAASHGDTRTEDLCIARGQVHDKFAWLLAAHLR